jgi:catalase-peroxidase
MRSILLLSLATLITLGCSKESKEYNGASSTMGEAKTNEFWWPEKINLTALRQHSSDSSPMSKTFDYSKEFASLDLKEVKKDIDKILTTSQDWWPADYGNYGPFFIRLAWHSAGTYRATDGRGGAAGGQQRFEPLNSWPDNASLDKARRLLWPVKQKYGKKISWADLMVLAGNVAMENMGFQTLGFAGGRIDDWEPDLVYWGDENKMLAADRFHGGKNLKKPFGATQMGLIYVNPEGPGGDPDPLKAAADIRETFARMAMNDEETAALIAGGHSFGKAHGAHKPEECLEKEPAAAPLEEQGFGWKNKCGDGKGKDTITSGLEGAWTATPVKWSHMYLQNLYAYDWVKTKSPGGATQWIPKDNQAAGTVPDAHVDGKKHAPIMLTTDLSLKFDPAYKEITSKWLKNPEEFEKAFARAWFKLTHRDMGPKARYIGSEVPKVDFIWQDPIPAVDHPLIGKAEADSLKKKILASGLSTSQLVRTAWASASTFRATDLRGGANGARIRLEPQKNWAINEPSELTNVLAKLEEIQNEFQSGGKKVSLADLIVLGGAAGIEEAAKNAGMTIEVPFKAGRMDASQEQTEVISFAYLEPKADPFRNYYDKSNNTLPPIKTMVDRANLLNLTVPELTVLIGGMRVLNANVGNSPHGVFTNKPGTLSNDFFVNLYDMSTKWVKSSADESIYEGKDRKTDKVKWTATPVDLAFGSSSELRAIGEVYAAYDGKEKFVKDFVTAWNKIMEADRFDIK